MTEDNENKPLVYSMQGVIARSQQINPFNRASVHLKQCNNVKYVHIYRLKFH